MHHDDVHLVAYQFGREAREPVVLVLGESVLKRNVLAFDITEFTQARTEAQERLHVDAFGGGAEKTDPRQLLRLLGLGSEWRGEDAGAHYGDERPPVHHWIISSARTKMDCGIVSPRALAVFRLITSSNLVGCSTGRSPGLAPLRILST